VPTVNREPENVKWLEIGDREKLPSGRFRYDEIASDKAQNRPLRLPLTLLTLQDTPLIDFFTDYIQWLIVYPLMVRNTQECCESGKGRYFAR